MATGVNVRSSFIITGGFKRAPAESAEAAGAAGADAAPTPPGSSRLTCAELFDEETGRSFMLPHDRTTPRERLFSTLWPTGFGGDAYRESKDGSHERALWDRRADVPAVDSSRMTASTP
jgi:hypothetical protein